MELKLRIRPVGFLKIATPIVLSLLLLLSASIAFAENMTTTTTGTDTGLPEFMIIEELEVPRGPFSDQKGTYLMGYPSGEFRPDAPITCAEAIVMLVRAYQLPIEKPDALLTPTKVTHWAMACLIYLPDLSWLNQVNNPIKQSTFDVFLNHVATQKTNSTTDLLAKPPTVEVIKPATSNSSSTNKFITRASAVHAINLALNIKPNANHLNLKEIVKFTDLPSNHPYYSDIVGVTVTKR